MRWFSSTPPVGMRRCNHACHCARRRRSLCLPLRAALSGPRSTALPDYARDTVAGGAHRRRAWPGGGVGDCPGSASAARQPCLRRGLVCARATPAGRIRSIRGSFAIEGNTLSEEQVATLLDGKPVIGPLREIQEARKRDQGVRPLRIVGTGKRGRPVVRARRADGRTAGRPGRYRRGGIAVGDAGVVPPCRADRGEASGAATRGCN